MKDRTIQVVATKRINIGPEAKGPAPPAAEIGASRRKKYVFNFPLTAAKALLRSRSIAPAYDKDARALRTLGCRCHAYFGAQANQDEPETNEKEKAPGAPSKPSLRPFDNLGELIEAKLASGLKDDLIAGLEAVGLDPDDFSTNGERSAALKAWQE